MTITRMIYNNNINSRTTIMSPKILRLECGSDATVARNIDKYTLVTDASSPHSMIFFAQESVMKLK